MRQNFQKKPFILFLALILVYCMLFTQTVFAQDTTVADDNDLGYLKSIMDMIKDKYKGDLTDSQLIEGA